jgi:hypothetical protein
MLTSDRIPAGVYSAEEIETGDRVGKKNRVCAGYGTRGFLSLHRYDTAGARKNDPIDVDKLTG